MVIQNSTVGMGATYQYSKRAESSVAYTSWGNVMDPLIINLTNDTAKVSDQKFLFDMDNNGWIDENDEIFNHLRIWHKDENGNDELVALGIAGIGAIYLGNRETRFSLKDRITNATNGMVQETGIYLREDGTAGTIQHVDLAKETA